MHFSDFDVKYYRNLFATASHYYEIKVAASFAIANDTDYGLSNHVQGEPEHARKVARRLRSGMVHLNGEAEDLAAPFGGHKMSGNEREFGKYGFEDFLETKAVMG